MISQVVLLTENFRLIFGVQSLEIQKCHREIQKISTTSACPIASKFCIQALSSRASLNAKFGGDWTSGSGRKFRHKNGKFLRTKRQRRNRVNKNVVIKMITF